MKLDVIGWLLEGDPAIRWQTLCDLVEDGKRACARERRKVALEGWGAQLLAKQDNTGTWAGGKSADGGLYTAKWTSTTYTMLLLRDLGLPSNNRHARRACLLLLDQGVQSDGGINYWWRGRSETCITGMVLSILSYFQYDDERIEALADYLLRVQMPDGGWNCRRPDGATHSSVHTTISVLEGLRFYELLGRGKAEGTHAAQARGREFLLMHKLFRSDRTGEIIKPIFLQFAFPPRWHYDILRALDYFRAVNAPRDERLAEAIQVVCNRRRADGRWPLDHTYRGKTYFSMERRGAPSRWNTLRALRVLRWWRQ